MLMRSPKQGAWMSVLYVKWEYNMVFKDSDTEI